MKNYMPPVDKGFEWTPARELIRGQFFFYAKNGKRHVADVVIVRPHLVEIISSLTDGRQVTRRLALDKYIITYT